MAGMPKQKMTPGQPDKPSTLSDAAALAWDKIITELQESNIPVSKAHRALITQAATIAADMSDAWDAIQKDGAYITNEKTGALMSHPAARRMDALRRDYIKVMSLIGLRTPVAAEPKGKKSLEDVLNG